MKMKLRHVFKQAGISTDEVNNFEVIDTNHPKFNEWLTVQVKRNDTGLRPIGLRSYCYDL